MKMQLFCCECDCELTEEESDVGDICFGCNVKVDK